MNERESMTLIQKLEKLTEYHQYLKGSTKFNLSVLEEIILEVQNDVKREHDNYEHKLQKAKEYIAINLQPKKEE
jgi:hypothetical protein